MKSPRNVTEPSKPIKWTGLRWLQTMPRSSAIERKRLRSRNVASKKMMVEFCWKPSEFLDLPNNMTENSQWETFRKSDFRSFQWKHSISIDNTKAFTRCSPWICHFGNTTKKTARPSTRKMDKKFYFCEWQVAIHVSHVPKKTKKHLSTFLATKKNQYMCIYAWIFLTT